MEKEELLKELSARVEKGEISQEDAERALGSEKQEQKPQKPSGHGSVARVLYIVGGMAAVIGIILFAVQVWEDIGSVGRIVLTLGVGIFAAAAGTVFLRQRPEDNIGNVFHFIGGVLIPTGTLITLDEFGVDINALWTATAVFGGVFALYLLLYLTHKRSLLAFFAVVYGSMFVYLLSEAALEDAYYQFYVLRDYFALSLGTSYLLLARAFRGLWNRYVITLLHLFGAGTILSVGFSLGNSSVPWLLFYFVFLFGGMFLSVYMRSRAILILSTLAFIAHITFITDKYFADSVGWPLSLVILGFLFTGLGYVSVVISRKYIKVG